MCQAEMDICEDEREQDRIEAEAGRKMPGMERAMKTAKRQITELSCRKWKRADQN